MKQVALAALLISIIFAGCTKTEEVKIGAILVLTTEQGEPLPVMEELLDGMLFAVESINTNGGIKGRKIKLIYRDCQLNTTLAQKQFLELNAMGSVAIINTYTTITTALAPLASQKKITQIALMATPDDVVTGYPYSFRFWPRSTDKSSAYLKIVKQLGTQRLGLVNGDTPYGNSISDTLAMMAQNEGIETSKIIYTSINDNLLSNLETLGDTDTVAFTCFPNEVIPLVSAIQKALPGISMIGPNILANPMFTENPILDGVYLPSPLLYNPAFPFALDIADKFQTEKGKRLNHYSAVGYDVINLITQLIAKSGIDREEIRKALDRGFTYPGVLGDVNKKAGVNDFSFALYPAKIVDKHIQFQDR